MIDPLPHNGPSSWELVTIKETSSTMDVLRDLLKQRPDQDYCAVLAEHQSHGRGRRGRLWHCEPGNLFLSFSVPRHMERHRSFEMSFVSAVSLAQTIHFFCLDAPLILKWPNDILLQNKKLAGILIEEFQEENRLFLLIGVGLNLVSAPQQGSTSLKLSEKLLCKGVSSAKNMLDEGMTDIKPSQDQESTEKGKSPSFVSLYESACLKDVMLEPPSPQRFTTQFLSIFEKVEKERREKGFSEIRKKWLKNSFAPGTMLTVSTDNEHLSAPFLDLDDQGRLLLGRSYETAKAFACGDVSAPQ